MHLPSNSCPQSIPCTTMLLLSIHLLLLLVAGAAATTPPPSPPSGTANGTTAACALLSKFGLPRGLLPDAVTNCTLADNGTFEVELSGPCLVQFEYPVYYDSKISGVAKYGGIGELTGIKIQHFLLWFDVGAIRVDLPSACYVCFDAGIISKKLEISQFWNVRSCRRNGIIGRAGKAAKEILRLPEPIREIEMLLTE